MAGTAVNGALLVAGTASGVGKSVLTAGICRWLVRQGVAVAPFKALNMSLNSAVTADGAEIGRSQAMQAAAAGIEPEAAMNPVLLKPGSGGRSQLVLMGRPVADIDAVTYRDHRPRLLDAALDCLASLRRRYDVVICEGAGGAAEINLRDTDVANLGLAAAADLPVIVVADIDRGGAFAALYGTVALLSTADRRLVAGFVVNRFRGSVDLLEPGLSRLRELTGRPVLGVLPWQPGLDLDSEDGLDLESERGEATPPHGLDVLRVSVVRLPHLSNATDVDPLAVEPGVLVRWASRPEELADADLVVLPGTRATVADLDWLRRRGLAEAVVRRVKAGWPVLGLCGGYQMLGGEIVDDVESRAGRVPGLGLLPARTMFAGEKTVRRTSGASGAEPVSGYEIHHGVVAPNGGEPFLDGCQVG
ncbi:MAG TPA: cobyric acid synthase, partial [Cryptosporangiaceae bacterium]|nr:cobyric acid synthase [Cryptosporangiaceae bacterium]